MPAHTHASDPIAARDLRKSYGPLAVLRGIDLTVRRGEVVALLGPNGAGKSTLLRLLASVARANRGRLDLFGVDCHPGHADASVRARIGFVAHEPLLYRDLSPRANLDFFARLYDARSDGAGARSDRIAAALGRAGLARAADRATRTLSRGMLQRLALARATLHDPELLLLDEPFTGLDPAAADLLAALIEERRRAGAVVIVSHDLARVAELASRAIVLSRGRIGLDLSPVPSHADLAHAYRSCAGENAGEHVGDRP
jgi:heme exporter protein A